MITLTYGGTTVQLPDDLQWIDEWDYSPIKQSTEPSLGGSLIVDVGTALSGRPITLQGDESWAWITRGTLTALKVWEAIPGAQLTLTINGAARTVIWDHERKAIQAAPIQDFSDPAPGDWCVVTLRFIEINA